MVFPWDGVHESTDFLPRSRVADGTLIGSALTPEAPGETLAKEVELG